MKFNLTPTVIAESQWMIFLLFLVFSLFITTFVTILSLLLTYCINSGKEIRSRVIILGYLQPQCSLSYDISMFLYFLHLLLVVMKFVTGFVMSLSTKKIFTLSHIVN